MILYSSVRSKWESPFALLRWGGLLVLMIGGLLQLMAQPALAHHPMGGMTPQTFLQGFLSGLGHPVIGIDHFVFIAATGLLAALKPNGFWIPMALVGTALVGTGLHLMGLDVPAAELWISLSVLLIGLALALRQSPALPFSVGLVAIAGLFHGYAYGEAIIGAEMGPLGAYLLGFSLIQLGIAAIAYGLGRRVVGAIAPDLKPAHLPLRFAGFAIGGAGAAFVSSLLLG